MKKNIKSTQVAFNILILVLGIWAAGCQSHAEQQAKKPLTLTPPMGWNSWDCFGLEVTEDQVKANADYMAANLKKLGWEYVVVDMGWYLPASVTTASLNETRRPEVSIDEQGRLVPDTQKFPSAQDGLGFKPLADYVHGLGLKFGIHIMRGLPWEAYEQGYQVDQTDVGVRAIADTTRLCEWAHIMSGIDPDKEGALDYYRSIISLYKQWGVDYIKADDFSRPYHKGEIELIRTALDEIAPEIVLSLSPGASPINEAVHLKEHANLWRISSDFWDYWEALEKQFVLCAKWVEHVGPGHWPDADMLPIGKLRISKVGPWEASLMGLPQDSLTNEYSRFTAGEQQTMMGLWSIFRSPLFIGGHLPENDSLTLALISNEEVLAVNQSSQRNEVLHQDENFAMWRALSKDKNQVYLGLFNLSESDTTVTVDLVARSGLPQSKLKIRDLWQQSDLGISPRMTFDLKAHESRLIGVTGVSDPM